MKIKLCCLFLFALSIFFLTSLSSAQKRSKSRIVRTNRVASLTTEQKSYIESVIDKIDSIERDLLSKPEDAVYTAQSLSTSSLSGRDFSTRVEDQIKEVISTYNDLGIVFGSVYHYGALDAQDRYTIATGGTPSNLASRIIARYNLQFQSPGQAICNLHALAFAARNRLQFTLLNSPTSENLPPKKPLSQSKIGGRWEVRIYNLSSSSMIKLKLLVEQKDATYILKDQSSGSAWYSPITEKDNKYYVEFTDLEGGISKTYRFEFDSFSSQRNFGKIFLKTNLDYEYVCPFELISI